ncbi:MAG: hypothetical protein ACTMIL_12760 [Brevibacterium aurantiacum]
MSITRAQRARFQGYAPTQDDIEAVMLALDTATDRLSNERAKRSRAEHRAVRAEAQSETRRQQTAYWQERAEGIEARIADVLALCDEWAAMGTRSMNIGAVRRALDAP